MVKKHIPDDVPERDTMSYYDHIKKKFKQGKATIGELRNSKKIKFWSRSKYDL